MKDILIIARHGATFNNEGGVIQGKIDSPLSEIGHRQAKALAVWANDKNVARIYSSELGRAVQTANIVASELSLSVNLAKELRERDCGHYEGLTRDELIQERARNNLINLDIYQDWRGARDVESDRRVCARFRKFLLSEKILEQEHCTLIVTHAGVIKSYLYHVFHIPYTRYKSFKIGNGGAVTFEKASDVLQMTSLWQNPIESNQS